MSRRSAAGPAKIEGPVISSPSPRPASRRNRLAGRFTTSSSVKAQHTEGAASRLHSFPGRDGIGRWRRNGLNEVCGLRSPRSRRGNGTTEPLSIRRDYLAHGRHLYGGHGAVVLGEIEGAMTRVSRASPPPPPPPGQARFEHDSIVTDNNLGLLGASRLRACSSRPR